MNRFRIACGCCGAALTVQALLHRDLQHTHAEYPDSPASSYVTTMSAAASGMAIPLITFMGNTKIMDSADFVVTNPPTKPILG
jgi:hypothetical protein